MGKKVMARMALLCLSIALLADSAVAKGWRGIVPLHSTRADVERLLGPPADQSEMASTYKLKDEVVFIIYASGPPCGLDRTSGWRVPRGTVVSITVSPKERLLLSSLSINESKYGKKSDLHRRDVITYSNKEEGESIDVFLGEVMSIHYLPAAKDKHLSCPGSS